MNSLCLDLVNSLELLGYATISLHKYVLVMHIECVGLHTLGLLCI